jgi:hypothetical protein
MKTLNDVQKLAVIDQMYPSAKFHDDNQALICVFFNDWSVYKAEKEKDLSPNTLIKKVKRVRDMITFIESLNDM